MCPVTVYTPASPPPSVKGRGSKTMSVDLTTVVVGLTLHLKGALRPFTIENKEDNALMSGIAAGFDFLRTATGTTSVPKGSDFLAGYSTTVGNTICFPKSVREHPLEELETLTHEVQHVFQYQSQPGLTQPYLYLVDATDRVQYEADAYAAGLAVRWWLNGGVGDGWGDEIANDLIRSYHLAQGDLGYITPVVQAHLDALEGGVVLTHVGKLAVGFLDKNYPQLKGQFRLYTGVRVNHGK